ncbi:DUF1223 domain-containing protein [Zavarzinella formosa]|uniref:DUF1223 domain-containing protein n=1 Tax=Zavarzinella formosa TaxID=360055 RepID=UPI00037F91C8|nr:DUF1223 domain-containing protein [Zavarzinella formosa]
MTLATRVLIIGLMISQAACAPPAPREENKGVAVVELFTSEGCSSCPPADDLLALLAADAKKTGRPVYCLSFHVDYWDDLGWKDRFSDAAHTKRQQEYARLLGLRNVYTPQMVVNGADEFLGSDHKKAAKAVETALAGKSVATVNLNVSADGREIAVEYKVSDAPAGTVLCVAWTETEASSAPDRGENSGQKLRHRNIVRDFHVVKSKTPFSGKAALKRRDTKSGTVIAFVQDVKSGRILGASSAEVTADR